MPLPDFANPIPPEKFPKVFREVVREIGQLVLHQTPAIKAVEQELVSIPDVDLVAAQKRSHFSRADVANRVARDFAKTMDGLRSG